MKTKRLHTVGSAIGKQDVCGECFIWVNVYDLYCSDCGAEFIDTAYSHEDFHAKYD